MQYYYHFTKIENLINIMEKGLLPMNGENSKLVGDSRTGVCVSLGIEGCVVFSARYWYKMMYIYNDEMIARKHFDDSVFIRFEEENLKNNDIIVENFSQIFSKEAISPDCLRVCYLKHMNGSIIIDRFTIMLYMMKLVNLPNRVDLEDFIYVALIKRLYENLKEDLVDFNEKEYQLLDIPLQEFVNKKEEFFPQVCKR